MIHVNPLASDGDFTIGYDAADGVAGQWPGDMKEQIVERVLVEMRPWELFVSQHGTWTLHERADGVLVWVDSEGTAYDPEPLLKASGDR